MIQRKGITQKEFDKLKQTAQPDCKGCGGLLKAIEPYIERRRGKKPEGEVALTDVERQRRHRERKKSGEL